MKKLCGVNPPVITIFDENYKIDLEASKKQADFLIEKGVDGLAYLGTSGEFSIMTVQEKKDFIREMTRYVAGRVNVIVGVGDTCLDNTLELLQYVESVGVDGVLLINPYFSVYSTEMVEAYFKYVASHTSLPIIIYNFPDLTGYCFNADVVCDLVKANPNIVGIKDTIADFNHLLSMRKVKEINPDFSVFCAYENQAMGLLAWTSMRRRRGSGRWWMPWISIHTAPRCSLPASRQCTTAYLNMTVTKDCPACRWMRR